MGALNIAVWSDRLVLEPMAPAHAELLFDALQDARIYEWISNRPSDNVEALRARWESARARNAAGEDVSLNWALRRRSDGAYVGKCDVEMSGAGIASNVGYLIFPLYWNSGYASEVLRALVSHLEQHGVHELHAFVTAGNLASERVLLKAGFERTRVLKDNDTIRGVRHDEIEYLLIRERTTA
jgi:[ribosomal protein S5]-alanine N-acetyltransferase